VLALETEHNKPMIRRQISLLRLWGPAMIAAAQTLNERMHSTPEERPHELRVASAQTSTEEQEGCRESLGPDDEAADMPADEEAT
jgi:hypothetical protein